MVLVPFSQPHSFFFVKVCALVLGYPNIPWFISYPNHLCWYQIIFSWSATSEFLLKLAQADYPQIRILTACVRFMWWKLICRSQNHEYEIDESLQASKRKIIFAVWLWILTPVVLSMCRVGETCDLTSAPIIKGKNHSGGKRNRLHWWGSLFSLTVLEMEISSSDCHNETSPESLWHTVYEVVIFCP